MAVGVPRSISLVPPQGAEIGDTFLKSGSKHFPVPVHGKLSSFLDSTLELRNYPRCAIAAANKVAESEAMVNLFQLKQQMCEIGRRIYQRGFAAANDGNISYRFNDREVLCTPTKICKGFMKPDDLCIVDLNGNQLAGEKKATSEIRLHLAIMKARPEVRAVVHCHPPHATAFGVAREPIPQCILPEVEIFLGNVPIAPYRTPGTQEFAETVLPFVDKTNVIILANHGTVSYDADLERAYWWTEVLDAYCRILLLARSLGRVTYFTEPEERALLQLKQKLGFKDPRLELENCELCANDVFRESWRESKVTPVAFPPPLYRSGSSCNPLQSNPTTPGASGGNGTPTAGHAVPEATPGGTGVLSPQQLEKLIQAITDRVMSLLESRAA